NVTFSNAYWGFLMEGQGAIMKNNIGLGNALAHLYQGIFGDAVLYGTNVASADYNFWSDLAGYSPFANGRHTSYDAAIVEPHSRTGNPLFVSTSPVVDTNLYTGNPALHVPNPTFGQVTGFQLNSGSPCIDAGTNVQQSYPMMGAAYDMGAYEHP